MADDEMKYYLSALNQPGEVRAVEPLVLHHCHDLDLMLDFWVEEIVDERRAPRLVSAVLLDGHWHPVMVQKGNKLHITTSRAFAGVLTSHPFPFEIELHLVEIGQVFPQDCGFQTFATITTWVKRTVLHSNRLYALMPVDSAAAWRYLFWQTLILGPRGTLSYEVAIGGHPDDIVFALATILHEHGVNRDHANTRSRELIQKLGKDQVRRALDDKRPWHHLKALANSHKPPFKIIHAEELQAVIQERSKTGRSFGRASNKQVETKSMHPMVTPGDLRIPPGVFVLSNQEHAHQIGLHQLRTSGKGIVVCSEDDAQPYVDSEPISTEGLALLVVNPSAKLVGTHGPMQRVPAQCISTGEPDRKSVV